MSAEPKGLQINVMGREFRVACPVSFREIAVFRGLPIQTGPLRD